MTRTPTKENQKDILTPTPLHQATDTTEARGERLPISQACPWFPNMTMPPKFKALEFEKYNGRGDPMIHLQMYCRKMAPYADNEPLLIQTFPRHPDRACSRMVLTVEESLSLERAGGYLLGSIRFQLPNSTGSVRSPEDGEKEQRNLQGICPERIEDAVKTKKIVDMTASNGISRTSRQEGSDKEKRRRRANDRKKQEMVEDRGKLSQLSPCSRYNQGRLRSRFRLNGSGPWMAPTPQISTRPAGEVHQYHPRKDKGTENL
uniref:Uncharacterized protein n=1 Tax=Fagus sylvatica TaxID=28930 RepID=A0A2N9IB24_FAGSY